MKSNKKKYLFLAAAIALVLGLAGWAALRFATMQPDEFAFPSQGPLAITGSDEEKGIENQSIAYYPDRTKRIVETIYKDGRVERQFFRSDGTAETFMILDRNTNRQLLVQLYDVDGKTIIQQTSFLPDGSKQVDQILGLVAQRSTFAGNHRTLQTVRFVDRSGKETLATISFHPDGKQVFSVAIPVGSATEITYMDEDGDRFATSVIDSDGEQRARFINRWSEHAEIIYRQPRYGQRGGVYFDNLGGVEHTVTWSSNGDYEFTQYSEGKVEKEFELPAGVKTRQRPEYAQNWKCIRDANSGECQFKLQSVTEFDNDGTRIRTIEFDIKTNLLVSEKFYTESGSTVHHYRKDGTLERVEQFDHYGYSPTASETVPADKGIKAKFDQNWLRQTSFKDPLQSLMLPQPEDSND